MANNKNVGNYNAGEVSITVGGVRLTGYAEGEFLNVERENQSFNKTVGSDGTTARAKSNDKSGTITVNLLQTSPSNALLSDYVNRDEATADGVFNMLIQDNSGTTIVRASTCWIQQQPTVNFSNEIENREWVIEAASIEYTIGGNDLVSGAA